MSSLVPQSIEDSESDQQLSDVDDQSDDNFNPLEMGIVSDEIAAQIREQTAGRMHINNIPALEQAIEDISLPKEWGWIEKLSVTSQEPLAIDDVQDDLKREAQFYQNCLSGVKIAIAQLNQSKIPFQRPDDFFAEMIKSDQHMEKVKEALLQEKKKMLAVDERKKHQHLKKISKQVQAERLKEKAKMKKDAMKTFEKGKQAGEKLSSYKADSSGFKVDVDHDMEDEAEKKTPAKPQPNKKRQMKDQKYGFGGKKRYKKANTAESSADMSSLDRKRPNKNGRPSQQPKHKQQQQKRPGKAARQQKRGK